MPEWVFIESTVLRAAREAKGLSYETMAREVHVSSKTWERYEKAGRVPRPLVARVAEMLSLEIEEAPPRRVVATPPPEQEPAFSAVLERLVSMEAKLDLLIERAGVPSSAARAAAEAALEAEELARRAAREGPPRRTQLPG